MRKWAICRTDRRRNKGKSQAQLEKLLFLIQKHFQILSEDRELAIVTQLELRQSIRI